MLLPGYRLEGHTGALTWLDRLQWNTNTTSG